VVEAEDAASVRDVSRPWARPGPALAAAVPGRCPVCAGIFWTAWQCGCRARRCRCWHVGLPRTG